VKFIRCPYCKCVKFLDKEGKVLWAKLLPCEEHALNIILSSNLLMVLTGGYKELEECCDDCSLSELN
jgi:hypothetical protein